MSWTIEYLPEFEQLRITTSGVLTMEKFRRLGEESLAAARQFRCHRLLVDHRNMTPEVSAADIHELPAIYAAMGLGSQYRIATLLAEGAARMDDFDFFEAVSWNRGAHNFRQFTDLTSALRWLADEA